ncbi:MAG: ABC transporter substrate-binding protein [Actinobacteria bacterium]|nr:ABC transporter substrate-binding protein [Actinomycetota bacterium]
MKKVVSLALFLLVLCGTCFGVVACGNDDATTTGGTPSSSVVAYPEEVVIGTMPVEDILPMWVAESDGIFEEIGINARVEVFQSAQELSVALAAGEVDFAMTDVQVATSLTTNGTPVTLEWVTLGATADQGRFGIMTSAASGYTELEDLAGVPVGVGSNTVPEYVFYKLMQAAGIPDDQIVGEEIKKLPVRYEMMTSNQVAAAALPASMLALGEATGSVLIADDTQGENISQSVMVVRSGFLETEEGVAALGAISEAWDSAVTSINSNPESYRALLIEKANLPQPVADSYPISTYPMAGKPTRDMVEPVLEWMHERGYLAVEVTYDPTEGTLLPAE